MTQLRSRSSSSSSPVLRPQPTTTTTPLCHPARNPHTTDANSHSASNSTVANSQSSAPVIALAPEKAVIVTSRAPAGTHIAQITTTFDLIYPPGLASDTQLRKRNYDTMVARDPVSDERMPAQVTAQVAPTSSDSSIPHPDSQFQSQSAPYTTSQPTQTEPSIPTVVPDSDSSLHSSVVDVDSPEGTGLHIEMGGVVSPPTRNVLTMNPQLQDHVYESLHIQEEKHVNHMTPISRPSTDDVGNKMCTTPSVTPPPVEQVAIPRSSPDSTTGPPAPSSTAPPSDRAPSRLELFELHSKEAIREHYRRTKVFHKTRSLMMYQTERMLAFASRGFERENLPTRQTKPPLLKRRHSIDVNTTNNWAIQNKARWLHCNLKQTPLCPQSQQTELPFVLSPQHPLPDPRRYAAFGPAFYTLTPHNSEILLELGDVTLQNDAFNYIDATDHEVAGIEIWMRGESLDMALEVLRRNEDCDAYGIDIVNSTVAQICNFAAMDVNGPSGEYEQYRARYNNKNWIIIICNDAIGGLENNGTSGSHWSMVVMDRISKRAYYYDSLYAGQGNYQKLGHSIALGMLRILGEDISQWTYDAQYQSPNQARHNLFNRDGGACGPFVFKMTQILIKYIKDQQALGQDHLNLEANYTFPKWVLQTQFHSGHIRNEMKTSILRWCHISWASTLADQHDHHAIHDTDAVLNDGPVVAFEIPPKPQLPVLRRTHPMSRHSRFHYHAGRRCSSGTNYHDPINLDDSDENHVMHNNSSNSGDSTAGSSDGATVITGHEDLWEHADVDNIDMDGGVRITNETDAVQDEHAPACHQRIMNNPPEPDDEEGAPVVTRLD